MSIYNGIMQGLNEALQYNEGKGNARSNIRHINSVNNENEVTNMEQTILNISVDSNDKKDFEYFCEQTGMNVSVAINMFIKNVLREQKLPFEVKADPFYSEANIKRLEKAINDIKSGKATLTEHELIEVEDD